jgi:hypothetical protein
MRRSFAILSVGLALASCSPATQSTGAGARPSSDLLTQTEIGASAYSRTSTYEAIEKLRPAFLRERATSTRDRNGKSSFQATLYVNGQRQESMEYLRAIPASEISEIRYLNWQDATARYGTNVPAGVLDVKLIGR